MKAGQLMKQVEDLYQGFAKDNNSKIVLKDHNKKKIEDSIIDDDFGDGKYYLTLTI